MAETWHVALQVRNALPETESLWYMGQSKEHRHLLKHPVISSFLWFKWERMRPYFNRYQLGQLLDKRNSPWASEQYSIHTVQCTVSEGLVLFS